MNELGSGTPLICLNAHALGHGCEPLQEGALYFIAVLVSKETDPKRPMGSRHCGWPWGASLRGRGASIYCGCRFKPLNGDDSEVRLERDTAPYRDWPRPLPDAPMVHPPVKVV